MSKINVKVCDVCYNIVDDVTNVYANGYMCDLCSNCYNKIENLEDMKHIHNVAIREINEMINKKVEGMKMKEKKILFKFENGTKICDIKNVNQEELLVFICETLETLIQKNIVTRDVMLTSINLCLTVGTATDLGNIKDKQLKKLIDELTQSMLMLFKGLDEANKNNK